MLKKRIIANLIVKNGIVVQSFNFNRYLPIGNIGINLKFLNDWLIDELILTDIDATRTENLLVLNKLKDHTKNIFVPLTYFGGLNSNVEVDFAFSNGADKVGFNYSFLHNRKVIENTIKKYGSQSTVISLNFIEKNGEFLIYDYFSKTIYSKPLEHFIVKANSLGVGEIILNSVSRDGSYKGFCDEILNCVKTNIPIILSGGAGKISHFQSLINSNKISGLAASNIYHFKEHSVTKLKSKLDREIIRMDPYFNYSDKEINDDFTLNKIEDVKLNNMIYKKIKDESI